MIWKKTKTRIIKILGTSTNIVADETELCSEPVAHRAIGVGG